MSVSAPARTQQLYSVLTLVTEELLLSITITIYSHAVVCHPRHHDHHHHHHHCYYSCWRLYLSQGSTVSSTAYFSASTAHFQLPLCTYLLALARVTAFFPALRTRFSPRRSLVSSSGLRCQATTSVYLLWRTHSTLIRWRNVHSTIKPQESVPNAINRVPLELRNTREHFIKPLPGYHKMLSFVEVVTTPSADTPGTLLLLHFDSRRYLVGNVPEGAQRACIERGIGLRKVAKILATGRTEWGNLGGLLGLILSMADTKISALSATATKRADQLKEPGKNSSQDDPQVEVHGSHNLNHLIATSRRFIFRTGMPIHAIEPVQGSPAAVEPTWQDDLIKVWSMAISPDMESDVRSPRKRTYDEANGDDANVTLTSPQTAYRDPLSLIHI